ncbi:MAG: DNA damage-inducible protein D [Cytophagales bacterium]|jgi:DNA-damage-inducible protein D|nr:DNA damage-inducible protein D [Cytophagales bacterium]
MKQELIHELFQKFEAASREIQGIECWSARELQELFGYKDWNVFLKTVEKAKNACANSGEPVGSHFVEVTGSYTDENGEEHPEDDIALTRYACYLVTQNGDPGKNEIAFAQTYYAVQTRKQEIIEQRLLDISRVAARDKLSKSEKKLSGIIYERNVDDKGFSTIRSEGDKAFFGGFTTGEMKKKLAVPDNRPLADFLPTLTIKAKDFAVELTSYNVVEKDLHGETAITKEHVDNNKAIRKMLEERGITPESLPAAEDVKKVKRKLENADKKVLKEVKRMTKKK